MSENDSIFRKIQALLAKAESTDFGPEAESLYAKAQELMLKHAIDEEMIRRAKPKEQRAKPVVVEFTYSESVRLRIKKAVLLNVIARENRCKVVLSGGRRLKGEQRCWIAGFEDDIEFVKMLYSSLSITVAREGQRQFKQSTSDSFSNFIRNFFDGFSAAIGKRLREQNQTTEASDSRALVLYDRKQEVAEAVANKFGRLRNAKEGRSKRFDSEARMAGHAAGMSANLSPGRNEVSGRGQKLIG